MTQSLKIKQNERENAQPVIDEINALAQTLQAQSQALNLLEKFFSMSLDLLCIAGTDGRFKIVNPAFTTVLAYEPGELLSRPFFEFIHPDDIEKTRREVEKLASGQKTIEFENRFRHSNGTYRIFVWMASPDPVSGLLYATARDVTLQRESEAKMRQIKFALDSHAIFALTDASGNITEVNDKFCEISGYTRGELIGQNHRIVNSGNHPPRFFKNMWQTIAGGKTWSGLIENRRKNGESYWVQSVITPIADANNVISRYMAIRFDVTAQKMAELAVNKLSAQLAEAEIISKIGFWELDMVTNNSKWSTGSYSIFGRDPCELAPSTSQFMEIIHPEDRATIQSTFAAIFRNRIPSFQFEFRILPGDGSAVRWVRKYGNMQFSADCIPIKLVGTMQDITVQRQTDIEKERMLLQLKDAQGAAKTGSWSLDLKQNHLEWSTEHYKIFQIAEPQAAQDLFRLYRNKIHPDDLQKLDELIERAAKFAEDFIFDHRIIENDGMLKFVQSIGRVALNSDGLPVRVSGSCQDLTDKHQQDEENRFIFDALGFGIWKFNPITQELYWDKSMYRLFDASETEFPGHYSAWEHSLSAQAKKTALEELGQALSGEREYNTKFEIDTKNFGQRVIRSRGKVVRNDKNEAVMMYGVNWDLTKEMELESKLHETKGFLASVINYIPGPTYAKDRNGRYLFVNDKFLQVVPISKSDIRGMTDKDFFPAKIADPLMKNDQLIFEQKKEFHYRESIPHPDGSLHSYDTYKFPVLGKNGEVVSVAGILFDITERLLLEEKLEEERVKALRNAKFASLGEMSAGIAHEINNPLAIISGAVLMLPKYAHDTDKLHSRIKTIEKAADRIAKIVTSLRKFSRTSDKSDYKTHTLYPIIKEALVLTEAKARRHSTSVELVGNGETQIICDEIEIEQVMVNLINNAIDAVKTLPERWVKLELSEFNSNVIVQVRNSGPKMAENIQQKIFQPFFTTKPVGQGTGLGLPIVKGILDEHHASIMIVAGDPHTCFEVSFMRVGAEKNAV